MMKDQRQIVVSRYARQEIFAGIGKKGQEKIREGRVVIVGLSGLGTVTGEYLTRAGVGHIRLIDGECVDWIELQRENLFSEQDARDEIPRAVAAKKYLQTYNSEIDIEEVVSEINGSNIETFIRDADVVIDAADNVESRLLINEACHALKKPWIYGGALASSGLTCNFLPEPDGPCLKCLLGDNVYQDGEQPTCATVGVLMSTIGMIASIQAAEALKMLVGSPDIRRELLSFDLWQNEYHTLPISKNPDCPVCVHGHYDHYGKEKNAQIQAMCGKDSVQIIPRIDRNIDFQAYASKLEKQGKVRYSEYTLDFDDGRVEIKLFKNGRAIIKHVNDEIRAKAVYAEYIGL